MNTETPVLNGSARVEATDSTRVEATAARLAAVQSILPVRAGSQARAQLPADDRALLRINGVSKSFAARRGWLDTIVHPRRRAYATVLDAVSLEVQRGELFALLGPNGAGKTTLFKILSGTILADQGTATVCGYDVSSQLSEVRKRLTPVIGDERSLIWRLSASENIRLYASLQGLRGAHRNQRVEEVLEVVELNHTGTQMVAQFSSGMKQRLLIARALLVRPELLLLDEPTRSLDPVSARRFRTFLRREIVERQGCTVLLATHNAEEALELSDRVGILNNGRLLRTGTPATLMAELHDHQYQLSIAAASWREFQRCVAGVPVTEVESDETGWRSARISVPDGPPGAGRLVRRLVSAGVDVSRLEPVRLSLAELIEQTVARQGEHDDA